MGDCTNPFYADNIIVDIISYLSSDEIINLSLLSRYHSHLVRNYHWVRNCHWVNPIIITRSKQLIAILSCFNFKNIGLVNKSGQNSIGIDPKLLPNSIREKIIYSNISFAYDTNNLPRKNTNHIFKSFFDKYDVQ